MISKEMDQYLDIKFSEIKSELTEANIKAIEESIEYNVYLIGLSMKEAKLELKKIKNNIFKKFKGKR